MTENRKAEESLRINLEELRNSIVDRFEPDSFKQFLCFKLDKELDDYPSRGSNFSTTVFNILQAAKREGWLAELAKEVNTNLPRQISKLPEVGSNQSQGNTALDLWKEKKLYLEQQLAITSDASQRFTLLKQIEECQKEITRINT